MRASANAQTIEFGEKIEISLASRPPIEVCALYPEREYERALSDTFKKRVVFRQDVVETVQDVQSLLAHEFREVVCTPGPADSELECFPKIQKFVEIARADAKLRGILAHVASCPDLSDAFDLRWQAMDRGLTFRFFDVLCVDRNGCVRWVSRAADLRASIVFRLRSLRLENVEEVGELPERFYYVSEEQFATMLVLNDTTPLSNFEEVRSLEEAEGAEERPKPAESMEKSPEI